jgi:hypothetical protein
LKYLKKYKIFESSGYLDHYLSKLGATKDDIRDIFSEVIDQGYELKLKVLYQDSNGRIRIKKSTASENPILKISLSSDKVSYVGGSVKFDSITYIETIYHSLSRFINTYGSNIKKITYELDNKAEITVNCIFETETDESKLKISKNDIFNCVRKALSNKLPDGYNDSISFKDFQGTHGIIKMSDLYKLEKYKELREILRNSEEKYINNYKEIESLCSVLRDEIAIELSLKSGGDIRFIKKDRTEGALYVFIDNVESYRLGNLSCYDNDSRRYSERIKTGFLSKKNIEVELFY